MPYRLKMLSLGLSLVLIRKGKKTSTSQHKPAQASDGHPAYPLCWVKELMHVYVVSALLIAANGASVGRVVSGTVAGAPPAV